MKPSGKPSSRPAFSIKAAFPPGRGPGAAAGLATASLLCAALASGEGFRDPTSSAYDLGRAGGRIAESDGDASAVSSNPANLSDVSAPQLEVSPEVVFFNANYEKPGVGDVGTVSPWKFLPDVFAALPVPKTPLTFGVGVTTPFGLSNEYPQNNTVTTQPGVLFPYYASLVVVNANPSLAWKINDRLQAGAGLDIFESQLDLRVSDTLGPGFTALGRYFGEGTGFGGNFGVTWEPVDGHRFAAAYRSPVGVDYSGSFHQTFSPLVPGASAFNSAITFPTIISAGYGWQVTKTIRLETDAEWIQFSRFAGLPLAASSAAEVGLPQSVAEDWKDTFTVGFAGDWSFAPGWVVRGGYQFYQNPVPATTFSPAIPDANQNVITAGLGYKWAHQGLELGYAAVLYNERDIATGPYAGKYQVMAHLISVTYRFAF